jgi:hypothetical protein
MVDCGPLAGTAVSYTGLWDTVAAFLHSITVKHNYVFGGEVPRRYRSRSPTQFNVPHNMLRLATSSMQSLGRFYRIISLESVIGVYGYISLVVYSEYNSPRRHRGRALNTTVSRQSSL